jgi:hypothetical protein
VNKFYSPGQKKTKEKKEKEEWKAKFEEFIKNCLYKAEIVLALVLPLLFRMRINVGQFPGCTLYCNNSQISQ